jgi:hypothetical protein
VDPGKAAGPRERVVECAIVAETLVLDEITCPSGELVLMDGGYLGLWSGDRAPEEVRGEDIPPAVDFEVVGRDADAAARSFDRQPGRTLYDIPETRASDFAALFDGHCAEHGLQASLRAFDRQVPHRDRASRAVANGDPYFRISGVPVVAVGGLPTDRPLTVSGVPHPEWGWTCLRVTVRDAAAADATPWGDIGVDWARFAIADADALSAWVHEDSIDGLADVVFWGRDQAAVAAEFGAARTGTPGEEDTHGWLDLPEREAFGRAVELHERRDSSPELGFAVDFRPHSHHWQVMAKVRASEVEAASIEVGGARVFFAMTSVGDGFFPVHIERDSTGALVSVRVTVRGDEDD